MKHYSLCPICGDGKLHDIHENIIREFNGLRREVPFQASVCDECGAETVTDKQSSFNKRCIADFYKEADGLLTGQRVREIREKLHLTQAQAAEIFGGGKTAFAKYEKGDVTQSAAMDKLLRVAVNVHGAFDYLKAGCPEIMQTITYKQEVDIGPVKAVETVYSSIDIINKYSVVTALTKFTTPPVNEWETLLA